MRAGARQLQRAREPAHVVAQQCHSLENTVSLFNAIYSQVWLLLRWGWKLRGQPRRIHQLPPIHHCRGRTAPLIIIELFITSELRPDNFRRAIVTNQDCSRRREVPLHSTLRSTARLGQN